MLSEVNDGLYAKKQYSKLNFVINVLLTLVIIVLVFEIFFSITHSGIYVIGTSMQDTLIGATEHADGNAYYIGGKLYRNYIADTEGDYVYVNTTVRPDYGKIVVASKDDGTTIIKRVIAKGGDYVKIDCGKVYIRHSADEEFPKEPIEEPYLTPEKNNPSNPNNTFYNNDVGFYVEEGCYFLLGDHRNVSLDSREGNGICFSEKQICGVVTEWSLRGKGFYTALHKFFTFDLPGFFGIENRVKSTKEVK